MEEYTNDDLLLMARLSPCILDAMHFLLENDIFKMNKKEEDIYGKVHS